MATPMGSGPLAQANGDVARKIAKWVAFTVVFSMLPVLFDLGVLLFRGQSISVRALSSDAATYLLGFGIIASGLGDALFEKIHSGGLASGKFVAALVLSTMMLAIGPALYAL